ncbi:hypothetical protein LUZ61_010277 [Rhynchospora tenuis]|uniref:EF-hand domain-containing protein n=1 Tax=Rhynchospora tenuis TaxID=198213 RepID=A0AAD6EZ38_9POAL|nr:hypothetical protein LUZ61_010277 [Rhynchospora tenuis]
MGEEDMTEYEKQRLSRIRENKARLEALGLPGLASSVRNDKKSVTTAPDKKRKKNTKNYDDEEYEPSDEDGNEEEDDVEFQPSEEELPSSSSSRRKGKRGSSSNKSKLSKTSHAKRGEKDGDFMDDDIALAEAIALSLGESVENKNGADVQNKIRKSNSTPKNESVRSKNKSRIQLSEDEVIAYFFSFDEVGKGYITAYDVEKMAIAHDFTWTDGEIAKMVRSFDSDGDRKLSLEDFRSIVSRCHMLQEPE